MTTVDAWLDDGIRHIVLVVLERPMPSPRKTGAQLRLSPQGRAYTAWRARMRDIVAVALVDIIAWPCPDEWHVGAAWAFGAVASAPIGARIRSDGAADQRTVKSVMNWDQTNLIKAAEDVCKDLLWADDGQVRYMGPGAAMDTDCDWWAVHAWSGPPGIDLSWKEAWKDRSVTETLRRG